MSLRETAIELIETGIEAASPARVIGDSVAASDESITINGYRFDRTEFNRVYLLGIGKASYPMAKAISEIISLDKGGIITSQEVTGPRPDGIEVYRGTHPTPSVANLEAARRLLHLAEEADERTLILFTISGGGSALYSLPAGDLGIDDIVVVNDALLGSGASIDEINSVRKHLSAVKGGRTARRSLPATVVSLILSDVVGDQLTTIASGPTVGDPTTFADARRVLQKYDLWGNLPPVVREHLGEGESGRLQETPKEDPPDVHNFVVGNNMTALEAVRKEGERIGYNSLILSSGIEGEAKEVGAVHAGIAREVIDSHNPLPPPALIISGGELTVSGTAASEGLGGPNREFVMGAAAKIAGRDGLLIGAVDTDGVDGRGKSGALADGTTVGRLAKPPSAYLEEHATQKGFDEIGDSIDLGKTGTNVNDLRIVVVE